MLVSLCADVPKLKEVCSPIFVFAFLHNICTIVTTYITITTCGAMQHVTIIQYFWSIMLTTIGGDEKY